MTVSGVFKYECKCGNRTFHLLHKPNSNGKLYFMCEDCHDICGSTDGYAVSWLVEDSDYEDE